MMLESPERNNNSLLSPGSEISYSVVACLSMLISLPMTYPPAERNPGRRAARLNAIFEDLFGLDVEPFDICGIEYSGPFNPQNPEHRANRIVSINWAPHSVQMRLMDVPPPGRNIYPALHDFTWVLAAGQEGSAALTTDSEPGGILVTEKAAIAQEGVVAQGVSPVRTKPVTWHDPYYQLRRLDYQLLDGFFYITELYVPPG